MKKTSLFLFVSSFLLLVFSCVFTSQEKKVLHFIVFADTQDRAERDPRRRIGPNSRLECSTITESIILSLQKLYNLQIYEQIYRDKDFSLEKLDSLIALLESNKQDIIVFYYTGHGINDSTSRFPCLRLPKRNGTVGSKHLVSVYTQLKSLPNEKVFVIAEACNGFPNRPLRVPLSRYNELDDILEEQPKGSAVNHFIFSSSKQGQLSHAVNGEMGHMAKVAKWMIESKHSSCVNKDFMLFFETLTNRTDTYAKQVKTKESKDKNQVPIWVAEL